MVHKSVKILKWIISIVLLFEAFIFVTGNKHINATLADTIFKGRIGPGIDNFEQFAYREIKPGKHQPWKISTKYNTNSLSEDQLNYINELQSVAYLVIHKDSILFEKYWDNINENTNTNSFSAAKSIVSILVGIAIQDGKIKSVDQKLADFLPEYNTPFGNQITIKHLLTMSSGINFDEDYINPFSFPAKSYYGSDIKKLVKQYEPSEIPGKTWRYRGGDTQLLSFVVERATGMKISEYASEKLWKPIGAKNAAFWGLDVPNGDEKASCCFNSNARDFARLGKLYLQNGRWNNQQIVAEQFVLESTHPATNLTDENGTQINKYGYQWWIINHDENKVFYARGILGQYIIVVPEKELIIVRLGHKREIVKGDDHPKDVKKYLDFALEMI